MHNVTKLSLGMIAAAVVFAFALPAHAQSGECAASRAAAIEHLAKTYGEHPTGEFYITKAGGVFEITRNDETFSWTGIVTLPNGQTCVAGEGDGFSEWAVEGPGEDS